MSMREIDCSLEQWQVGVKDLRRRMVLAPTPRERERWYAILLLAQGLTAAVTADALERDPHTIGRWAPALGEGGGHWQSVLGRRAAVQERVGKFLAGLAGRKDKARRRCRTVLQSRAETLPRDSRPDSQHPANAHPSLALVWSCS